MEELFQKIFLKYILMYFKGFLKCSGNYLVILVIILVILSMNFLFGLYKYPSKRRENQNTVLK